MHRLLILADDLTGAADCASAFLEAGLNATVILNDANEEITGEVLSIDCDTRHLSPVEAAACVARIMRRYTCNDPDLPVFKKIDSTLRGNIGAELRALLEERRLQVAAGRRVVALMAPAFPASGRTTVGGYQTVHGTLLHRTETWALDGMSGEAYIPAMLREAGLQTALIPLERIRCGHSQLSAEMQRSSQEVDVLICDAECDEDLETITKAFASTKLGAIYVGSAGLAYQLPRAIHLASTPLRLPQPEASTAPILFVVGSMSSHSHRQAAMLVRDGPVNRITILANVLLDGPSNPAWATTIASIEASLTAGQDTLLLIDPAEQVSSQNRRRLTIGFGLMLAPYAKIIGALVATGGETARAILDRWGVHSLIVLGAIEHGLPYSLARLQNRSLPVLTKAGALGSNEALINCRSFLIGLLRDNPNSIRNDS